MAGILSNGSYILRSENGSGGKTYEGVEPIVVNNDENKISANCAELNLENGLYFDSTTNTIGFSGIQIVSTSAEAVLPGVLYVVTGRN